MRVFRKLLLIELAAIAIYVIAGIFAYYAKIYRSLPISQLISFQAAQMFFIFGAQTLILMLVFYRWFSKDFNNSRKPINLQDILSGTEDHNLEFKSSLRWDYKQSKVNPALEKSVMKTVAAFLNSKGGYLVIGVDDQKNITGLQKDITTLRKPDLDGFENHFNNIFKEMIGP